MSTKTKLIKILGSLILLSIIIYRIDLGKTLKILTQANIGIYLISFAIFLIGLILSSFRWGLLLKSHGKKLKFLKLLRMYSLGLVFNFTLPSDMGGDVVKIYKLSKNKKITKTQAALSTLMDRFLGLNAIIILIAAFIPFNPFISSNIQILIFSLFLIAVIATWGILFKKLTPILYPIKFVARKLNLSKLLEKLLKSFDSYRKEKKLLTSAFLVSLLFQTRSVFTQNIIFQAINIQIPILFLFLAIPFTKLMTALPISIGGVGVREGSLIAILSTIGISGSEVFAYTLLTYTFPLILAITYAGILFFENIIK